MASPYYHLMLRALREPIGIVIWVPDQEKGRQAINNQIYKVHPEIFRNRIKSFPDPSHPNQLFLINVSPRPCPDETPEATSADTTSGSTSPMSSSSETTSTDD